MDKLERHLGFYTKELFWAIDEPEIQKIKNNPSAFTDNLSKVVLQTSNKDFSLKICRDGLIMMQIKQLDKIRESKKNKNEFTLEYNSEYLSYLNTFQFLLASETYVTQSFNYFRNRSISTFEVLQISAKEGHILGIGWMEHNIINHVLLGRFLENYSAKNIEKDFRIAGRNVITEIVLKNCLAHFKKLFKDSDSFYIFSQINSGFSEFSSLNFRQCLTLSWFCIEYFINKDWINFLNKKKESISTVKRISGDRRKVLLGKDYSASVMSNILELNNIIPHDIFLKIENVRSKRNNIVHNLDRVKRLSNILKEKPEDKSNQPIHLIDCLDCFDILRHYVSKYYKVEIKFPVGFTYIQI